MVLFTEYLAPSRYARPFLGTGVIGAYTTFSTYVVEADLLVRDGHSDVAAAYALASLVCGLVAVWGGIVLGRLITRAGGE
jgi:CrcB protein